MHQTLEDKIKYLDKLLNIYLQFSRRYKQVDLIVNKDEVTVRWSKPKSNKWYLFEEKCFPLEDIDSQIESYKGKIRRNFASRKLK